jgi:hypothetical protein
MKHPNTEPMPLSGDKDISGVPVEIIKMREAQRKAREEQRAKTYNILAKKVGKKGVVNPDKRNIR